MPLQTRNYRFNEDIQVIFPSCIFCMQPAHASLQPLPPVPTKPKPQHVLSLKENNRLMNQKEKTKTEMTSPQTPKIDMSGLDPADPKTPKWRSAREQVTQALEEYGWLEVAYDEISQELKEAVLGRAVQELFALPEEAKTKNVSGKANHGYVGGFPGMEYEGLCCEGAHRRKNVEEFARMMWSQGHPSFCETIHTFAKLASKLEQIVRRMILESLGVEAHIDKQNESLIYALRLAEYGAPGTDEPKVALNPHTDPTTISIVCQHRVLGLEVPAKDHGWIRVAPSPNSFVVLIGEAFEAWSNGRLQASVHRVCVEGSETRYSAVMASYPKDGHMIQGPDELVDAAHPLVYRPYEYSSYVNFRYSEEGREEANPLKAFCGITKQ